ncbi:MAG: bifunctional 23S rRNA (guanine(2069)-N(7))-methyltransferase RlmK/23S rRNA (guanine(2445)-N(2))-methyltransferase RlmL [Xanthomonadales bacterium]|nr:bifunctional 23S rRNA (guanine(2069)-N(7))-methyltransferase RlmK/23S rRNA (guanine(2445)-N(2))-methyltransferase RlmL [Xanthomonadales bacterium]
MIAPVKYFATCAKGLEYLLVDELRAIGAVEAREALAGVHFQGDATLGLRACLWSRLASRILLPLAKFEAADAQALYDGVAAIDWTAYLAPDQRLTVDAHVRASAISQGMFAGQRVKDAIVDQLRARHGRRPDVDPDDPDLRVHLRLVRDQAVLSLDLAGQPLHERGWRQGQGKAPIKETLAAAMLLRAGWPQLAASGAGLLDPFCGIGTLVIEAAWMAADIAPGFLRGAPGCARWPNFDADAWQRVMEEAGQRREHGLAALAPDRLHGWDLDARLVELARVHAEAAGVGDRLSFRHTDALRAQAPEPAPALVIANLPYGARLGDDDSIAKLYPQLGQVLRERFADSQAALLTLADGRGRALGLRARRRYALSNGALAVELLLLDPPSARARSEAASEQPLSDGAVMVANRLRKNERHLRKWRQREGIECWRLYDADLPEYAAAVDLYGDRAVVQEYQAPADIPEPVARKRLGELVRAVRSEFGLAREQVVIKKRQRQRGGFQYQTRERSDAPVIVNEAGLRFEVRLDQYLDTGLYLDHRLVRDWIGQHAQGRDFLNLFSYTASASIHAAAGGARSTTSVDLSGNYLAWAQRNFELNGLSGHQHRLVQADVMAWLAAERGRYGAIYVDPPTFSNSKSADDFDVQRQHVALLHACGDRLAPDGWILFSNHFRRFQLDHAALAERFAITDLGPQMLPPDFRRNPRIHQVYRLVPH